MEENQPESRTPQDSPENKGDLPPVPETENPVDRTKKGSREKIRIRYKVKGERDVVRSKKKAKAQGGITYSAAKDSALSKGNTFFLVALLIVGSCVVMAYLVLSRLGTPPPLPSD